MPLSTIEHYLSYHTRLLLPHVLSRQSSHRIAYIFSLLSAVSAGFITLISLYSQPWQHRLNYSSWQINTIASMTNLGMYLTPPILGMIADSHGPITLSFLAIVGFIPSYSYLAYVFNHPELSLEGNGDSSFNLSIVCFTFIGISTSALYFSALLTCTKLYPRTKLLSISLPTTCYGISSVVGSQLLRIKWFWSYNAQSSSSSHVLNLGRVFQTFAWIYVVIGVLAWIATSVVSLLHFDEERDSQKHFDDQTDVEQLPLLEPENRAEEKFARTILRIFTDPVTYILALSILLSLGPLEMFIANMGSLANLLVQVDAPTLSTKLLSTYALSSTFTRLMTGIIADFFARKRISIKWILLTLLSLGVCAQLFLLKLTSSSTVSSWGLVPTGSLVGVIYGGLFTVYPTLVLLIWGERSFGTVYGSLLIAPAVGSTIFCMLYAKVYDSRCMNSGGDLLKSSCISVVYKYSSMTFVASITLSAVVFWKLKRRNLII
ncbi:mch1p [Saccharomyces arboricola H-6]|uniref:Probable transporter MCH1 n=1 Tax=Saccharomyces arboricola (strain H-6 / AS 2.3317 / CBS 10644) TaxID=1160507 RepID=J8Q6Y1_SACAR|nr:mch1p [Saccharomyces arboricola H-6]